MKWLTRALGLTSNKPIDGVEYRVTVTLYNAAGTRSAEVWEFAHGDTYLLEAELIEGIFTARHDGNLVGPFASPKKAERFIVSTKWFRAEE